MILFTKPNKEMAYYKYRRLKWLNSDAHEQYGIKLYERTCLMP